MKQLHALMTKLTWQLNELNVHLQEAQQQMQALEQQMSEIDIRINKSGLRSLTINPELEINRLNFMTQQQEQKDILLTKLKNHQGVENKLQEKIQRAKTELKMLEQYLNREAKTEQKQQKKAEDNAADEWITQKRKSR